MVYAKAPGKALKIDQVPLALKLGGETPQCAFTLTIGPIPFHFQLALNSGEKSSNFRGKVRNIEQNFSCI